MVHLAQDGHASEQAIPRVKEEVLAGMMEALLEQVLQMPTIPHFLYASSYEVYNHLFPSLDYKNPVPFSEDKPITTPSSLHGASKVIDELLARAYHEQYGIFSVGLRFFSVYGPWSVPGSPLFEMAERAVTDSPVVTLEESDVLSDVRDYVYIDDAVDAIMAAMQYQTPDKAPVVINVGTGVGTSLHQVAKEIQDLYPSTSNPQEQLVDAPSSSSSSSATISYANIERAKLLLGFQPRVSLRDGLIRLLSWHYDRAFPYGGRPESPTANPQVASKRSYIVSQGIASCSPFDKECMRGAPVFPCASECSHDVKCTTSIYDDVLFLSRSLTSECSTVMYTVDLNRQLAAIPSANMAISTHHSSHLPDGCNIAFVSEDSELIQRLKKEQGFSMSMTAVETFMKYANKSNKPKVLKHGFWTLVPVSTPTFVTGDEHIYDMLPKLSPGLFFGEATTHAIYCDIDVVFKDIPSLLQEAKMQPYRAGTQGATAMLVARQRPAKHNPFGNDSTVTISVAESLQNAAYRMVRIGVIDEMSGDGYHPLLDSSWVVHALQKEDSRLFRCDVFGEVVQWNVGTDNKAFEFIMSLHDMWSRVITQDNGIEPWWLGDGVVTVPQNHGNTAAAQSRRLEQVDDHDGDTENDDGNDGKIDAVDEKVQVVEDAQVQGDDDAEQNDVADDGDTDEDDGDTGDDDQQANDEEEEDLEEDLEENVAQDGGVDPEEILEKKEDSNVDEDMADEDTQDEEDEKDEAFANEKGDEAEGEEGVAVGDQVAAAEPGQDADKGFLNAGNDRVDVASPGEANADQNEEEEGKTDDEMQDDESDERDQAEAAQKQQTEVVPGHDHSSYDTWMGILSSTSVQYFVRIVPSSEVGATYLDDYKY